MERKCNYRNCNNYLPDEMKSNAKYCNRNCKTCERKYNKREDNKIKKDKSIVLAAVKDFGQALEHAD